jgi:hypothetical protein
MIQQRSLIMPQNELDAIVAEFATIFPPLLNVEEAAKIARVPPATIHSWSSAGRLDGFKVRSGRRILFHRDVFVRFVLNGGT